MWEQLNRFSNLFPSLLLPFIRRVECLLFCSGFPAQPAGLLGKAVFTEARELKREWMIDSCLSFYCELYSIVPQRLPLNLITKTAALRKNLSGPFQGNIPFFFFGMGIILPVYLIFHIWAQQWDLFSFLFLFLVSFYWLVRKKMLNSLIMHQITKLLGNCKLLAVTM